jgi:hypothetical protein
MRFTMKKNGINSATLWRGKMVAISFFTLFITKKIPCVDAKVRFFSLLVPFLGFCHGLFTKYWVSKG